ncbi:MAG: histidine triad nucleotide-binding protein [Thermoguttaceae bacterium]
MAAKTVFKRIIDREIPADIVYEDDLCLVFRDINPQAPVHLVAIPKKEIPSANDLQEEDGSLVGHLFVVLRKLAAELGLSGGYRVVTNCGPDAGQSVAHLHFHLLAGRPLGWPPG